MKPLAVHVDYVCRVGDLFSREDDECWHKTAEALVASCNAVLARYGHGKATCEKPAPVGVAFGSCCRCGKQH